MKLVNLLLESKQERTSDGDLVINLPQDKFNSLDKEFEKYGLDLDSLSSELEEKIKDVTKASSDELDSEMASIDKSIVIDKEVLDGLDALIEEGLAFKDWYIDFNRKAFESLSEQDAVLFLAMFAITSSSTSVTQNFQDASRIVRAVKHDINNSKNRKNLEDLIDSYINKTLSFDKIYKMMFDTDLKGKKLKNNKFNSLSLSKVATKFLFAKSKIPNILYLLNEYKKNNYTLSKSELLNILKDTWEEDTATVKKKGKGGIITSEKIFSFTMNLLDPNFKFDSGWQLVTIDRHILAIFYPKLSSEERKDVFSKLGNVSDLRLARITVELQKKASKYNMLPNQIQAAIWCAYLKREKPEGYISTFEEIINESLKKIGKKEEELKEISKFFDKVIEEVGKF